MKKRLLILFSAIIFAISIWLTACSETNNLTLLEENEELSGGNATGFSFSEEAFGGQIAKLSATENDKFQIGNSFFRNNWVSAPSSVTARDGLGVLFNTSSCGGCHFKDGRAAAPDFFTGKPLNGLLFRLSIGKDANGDAIPDPNYGGQLNDNAILSIKAECKVQVNYEEITGNYADGTTYKLRKPTYQFLELAYGNLAPNVMISPRIAPQMAGLGLLEAIDEATILSFADDNDRNNDGISGKANYVWDTKNNKKTLGRFGWKANQPSLHQQTAGAFLGDIGITSSLFSSESLSNSQNLLYANLSNGGNPEISDENLDNVVFYTQTLAIPARRNYKDAEVLAGKQVFIDLNCGACHIPKMQTGSFYKIQQLNNQVIRPYTDLLLHDMGKELADNRPDFEANGQEWKTPPLWGIGLIKTVNKHTNLLHDGRARTMEEAVLWHGGEAQKSKDKFAQLPKNQRDKLIKFLESL